MGLEASGDSLASLAADATANVPQAGEVIGGKFVVERVLGIGGMGVVVAAHHSHLEQTVAIKFLRRDAAKDEAAVNRFLREARAVAGLQSEHVVRVMDAGRLEDGLPYLVMEYLNGTDLDQVLVQKGRLGFEECLEYLLQAMEAVAEAHAAGIVHRDLKPSNLFLTERPDGTRVVKVLDFGISKALDIAGRQNVSLTATSMTLGSPLYMSPEQVRSSKSVDARTDIWALGIIAYELLAGIQPFEADTVTGLCAKIVADEPLPLRSVRPDVPPAFEAVVMRCLEKNVASRFQSMSELANALRPFTSGDGLVSVGRILRIGGGLRPTLASAHDGRISGSNPSAPTPSAPVDLAAGYAETVATWQTTGTRRSRRALAATAGTVGGLALLIGAIVATRGPGRTVSTPAPAAVVVADIVGDVRASTSRTEPTPPPPAVASTGSAPAAEPAPASSVAGIPLSHPSNAQSQPVSRHAPAIKVAVGGTPSAKPPAAKTQDELLLDRK